MTSLSSTENEMDSPWVPSRRVVSKVKIFINKNGQAWRPTLLYWHPGCLFLLEERHHLTEASAHDFDRLIARLFPHGQELAAAALVLVNPLARKLAGLDLRKNLLHLLAGLLIHDARPARVIAIFRGVRN